MEELFNIRKCFHCPNRTMDLDGLEKKLRRVMAEKEFNRRHGARLNTSRPLHHQMFHIALAGCPNSCSQPQIKDFGVQGQAIPEPVGDCNLCGACIDACREGAVNRGPGGVEINRELCLNCGQCIRACPTGALREEKTGFRVLAGGKLGRRPRLAEEIIPVAGEEEVAASLGRYVDLFLEKGRPGERLGELMERKARDGDD